MEKIGFCRLRTTFRQDEQGTMAVDNISEIRNKVKRQQLHVTAKMEKAKAKRVSRKARAEAEKADPKLKEVPQPAFQD